MRKTIMAFVVILTLLLATTTAFADRDPNVVIVNPGQYSTVYSDSLLISVKVLEPKSIRISFYEELEIRNDVAVTVNVNSINSVEDLLAISDLTSVLLSDREYFECTNYLSFYTKNMTNLAPGLYRVRVDTLDSYGQVIYTANTYVILKDKSLEQADAALFEGSEPTTLQRIQTFFTNIFQ